MVADKKVSTIIIRYLPLIAGYFHFFYIHPVFLSYESEGKTGLQFLTDRLSMDKRIGLTKSFHSTKQLFPSMKTKVLCYGNFSFMRSKL